MQPKIIDLSTRLWGITRVYGVYSPEPRTEVDCSRLNFNISKSVYHRLHLGHFWANMEFSRSNLVTFCLSMYLLLNKEHSLRQKHKFSRAHWLIFIVNKRQSSREKMRHHPALTHLHQPLPGPLIRKYSPRGKFHVRGPPQLSNMAVGKQSKHPELTLAISSTQKKSRDKSILFDKRDLSFMSRTGITRNSKRAGFQTKHELS